jgi:hypothetical protein
MAQSESINVEHMAAEAQGERALTLGLVISGIRCSLQYMIFPFVLPLLGIGDVVGVEISLLLNAVAAVSILFSIRRFWRINYRHKLAYTVVGLTALVILTAFTVLDLQTIGVIV